MFRYIYTIKQTVLKLTYSDWLSNIKIIHSLCISMHFLCISYAFSIQNLLINVLLLVVLVL